ncbi:glycosyltransferase family 4 protein [Euhalothece natronophila Z-M001]|uniref:Glycosyltransferase family 4 protein n=1 Tax=Euhalothece natronophila Z-M001 TaxID=522448 RepID=A0A5B8NIS7_9CHRO|nr:glycosyltransferase family 4 protein [Euhalothece natronophila]QDZ39122.1 glycosyltransferase family 4 protein [Euhalothece natronophila Z-M001]
MKKYSSNHICIVTHKVIKGDGQGRVNYEIVQEAIARGYQVTILASVVDSFLSQHSEVNWVKISVSNFPTELLRNFIFSWQSTRWLRQHHQKFDLIKVNGAITQFPGDVNAVHFVHSAWARSPYHTAKQHRNFYGLYQWLYTKLNAFWEKQAFHRAKSVIAVSHKVKEELSVLPPEKIKVIPNGVDLDEFSPGTEPRHVWQLPEKVPLALFVGDIRTSRKNLEMVLHALIPTEELHLAVVGDTQDSPYPKLATELGLEKRVHFLGYRQDIAQIMRATNFFVFPSRYEPFGLVVLEAMASGLPVITIKSVGAADLVTSDCGLVLSDSENISALTEALTTLSNNLNLRTRMGKAARTIAEQYSWKTMAQHYLDLFEKTTQ